MADNTTLDPGTGGDVIATDDVSGVKYQKVKLVDGTADSSTAIPGDATNGLDVDVTRVQGTVTVDGSGVTQPISGTVTVNTLPAGDNNIGNVDVVSLPALAAGTNNIGDVDVLTLPSIPAGTNNIGDVDIASIAAGDNNIGNVDVVTLPNVTNGGTFAVQDSQVVADDAAFTVGTTKVFAAGFLADQASTDSVNEGDAGAARMTLDRKQIVTVAPSADTEGLTIDMNIDVDETEDAVKASAGKLYGWYIYNDGASEVYVKYYNATTANVTVGSTTPVLTIPVPAASAANVEYTNGLAFSTAITVAATTGVGTADTGAPAANQVIVNSFYQ